MDNINDMLGEGFGVPVEELVGVFEVAKSCWEYVRDRAAERYRFVRARLDLVVLWVLAIRGIFSLVFEAGSTHPIGVLLTAIWSFVAWLVMAVVRYIPNYPWLIVAFLLWIFVWAVWRQMALYASTFVLVIWDLLCRVKDYFVDMIPLHNPIQTVEKVTSPVEIIIQQVAPEVPVVSQEVLEAAKIIVETPAKVGEAVKQAFEEATPEEVLYAARMDMAWFLLTASVCAVVLYLCWRVIKFFTSKRVELGFAPQFICERMVDGSHLFPAMGLPAFQCWVEVKMDGKWYRSGCGFRAPQGVFTALHVLAGASEVRLAVGNNTVLVQREDIKEYGVDAVLIDDKYALILGLKQAKIAACGPVDKQASMVTITNGRLSSMGLLEEGTSLGSYNYRGSTVAGFSGAPYYMGGSVYGMHIGAGSANFGYDIGFLIIKLAKPESSEDWVTGQIRKGRNFTWANDPHNPDEVIVKVNGKYAYIDRAAFNEAYEDMEYGTTSKKAKRLQDQREDDQAYYRAFGRGDADGPLEAGKKPVLESQKKEVTAKMTKVRLEAQAPVMEYADGPVELPAKMAGNECAPIVSASGSIGASVKPEGRVRTSNSRTSPETTSKSPSVCPMEEVSEHQELMRAQRSGALRSTLENIVQGLGSMTKKNYTAGKLQLCQQLLILEKQLQAQLDTSQK